MSKPRLGSEELVMVKHKDDAHTHPTVWVVVEMDRPFGARGRSGEAGDYLMRDLAGEYHVCWKWVFERDYVRVDARGELYG